MAATPKAEVAVYVYYFGGRSEDGTQWTGPDDPRSIVPLLRVLKKLAKDDFETATRLIDEGQGLVAGPVSEETARVMVDWIESVGGCAGMDDWDEDAEQSA